MGRGYECCFQPRIVGKLTHVKHIFCAVSAYICFHITSLLAELIENSRQFSLNINTMSRSVRVSYVFADVHFLHFDEL